MHIVAKQITLPLVVQAEEAGIVFDFPYFQLHITIFQLEMFASLHIRFLIMVLLI